MKLLDLFEARFQEIVHTNPSVGTLKALARANRYHSARFVIYKDGTVKAADSEHFTHHSLAPAMEAWAIRGYVTYVGDGEYLYRSMEVYSPRSMDHPIFRVWERAGIGNGNPEVVEEDVDPPLPYFMYHVSRKRNRGSILKLGIVPKTREHTHILRRPGVFAFETLEQAEDWAWNWAYEVKEPMDIWAIKVENSDLWLPDPSREMQRLYDCWVIYQKIPLSDIRLLASQPVPTGFFYRTSNPKKIRYLEASYEATTQNKGFTQLTKNKNTHRDRTTQSIRSNDLRSGEFTESVKGDDIARLLGVTDKALKDWVRQQTWTMATIPFPGISGNKSANESKVKFYQQQLMRGEKLPPGVIGPNGKLIAGIDQAQAAANLSLKVLVWLPTSQANLQEKWTKKYKKSINCNAPKGFSQRAHCAARRKRRAGGTTTSKSVSENRLDALVESILSHLETQGLTEAQAVAHIHERLDEDLRKWFKQKWVRFGPDGRIRGACARGSEGEGKPKCLPQKKAWALGKKRRATAARRKRREDPNPEREGRAKNVATKESQNFAPEMLAETAQESQDINTLAKFITSNILNKRQFAYTHVYKLVPADKWPKIKSPIIQQMLSVLRIKNIKDPTRTATGTIGRDDDGSLWMYIAPGRDPMATASTITHELTHGLDLFKSQGKAFKSGSYEDKPDSSVWTADDWKNYTGNPMEINARFAQVLMFISDDVIENLHNDPNWSLSRDHLVNWITKLFEFYKIDRSWFAEGPKGQKSYNRLLSRTMQFYQQLDKVARQDAVQKPGLLKKISTAVGSQVAKLISTFGLGKKGDLDEDFSTDDVSCPSCGGPIVAEGELLERKDACYYKVKSRYKVWPSAYASGALVQCRKKGAANWGNKGKKQ